jgi:hypothetical protein
VGFFAKSGILNERGFFGEGFDPDALDYINRVETADGERLEPRVRTAINQFVLGCKQDGVWTSLVTSCIMAGARTVAGAITPLVGNAPTNNNFVAGDYSRTLGLLGNDSNKYLATGYNNNDTTNFPQNNSHISCFVSVTNTDTTNGVFVGNNVQIGNFLNIGHSGVNSTIFKNRTTTNTRTVALSAVGFQGISRDGASSLFSRQTTSGGTISDLSQTTTSSSPTSQLYGVFASGTGSSPTSARLSFYSIGKSLSIPNLDRRVTTLMTTLASVIT